MKKNIFCSEIVAFQIDRRVAHRPMKAHQYPRPTMIRVVISSLIP